MKLKQPDAVARATRINHEAVGELVTSKFPDTNVIPLVEQEGKDHLLVDAWIPMRVDLH